MYTPECVDAGPAEVAGARAETCTLPPPDSLGQRRLVRALAVVGLLRFPQVPEATELVRHLQFQLDGDPVSPLGHQRNTVPDSPASAELAQPPDRATRCSLGSLLRRNRTAHTASRPSAT